jgi:hypothetical protein
MLSPATKPPGGLAAHHSLRHPGQRGRRLGPRIEHRPSSNCGTNCGTNGGTNCRTNPTASRPRVSLVAARALGVSTFSTSLPQPCLRLSVACAEFALQFALRFALWFAVPAFGMARFADGGAGFRRSCDFDISSTGTFGCSTALLAARTSRVVVARRRLSWLARRVVAALDSPAWRMDEAS